MDSSISCVLVAGKILQNFVSCETGLSGGVLCQEQEHIQKEDNLQQAENVCTQPEVDFLTEKQRGVLEYCSSLFEMLRKENCSLVKESACDHNLNREKEALPSDSAKGLDDSCCDDNLNREKESLTSSNASPNLKTGSDCVDELDDTKAASTDRSKNAKDDDCTKDLKCGDSSCAEDVNIPEVGRIRLTESSTSTETVRWTENFPREGGIDIEDCGFGNLKGGQEETLGNDMPPIHILLTVAVNLKEQSLSGQIAVKDVHVDEESPNNVNICLEIDPKHASNRGNGFDLFNRSEVRNHTYLENASQPIWPIHNNMLAKRCSLCNFVSRQGRVGHSRSISGQYVADFDVPSDGTYACSLRGHALTGQFSSSTTLSSYCSKSFQRVAASSSAGTTARKNFLGSRRAKMQSKKQQTNSRPHSDIKVRSARSQDPIASGDFEGELYPKGFRANTDVNQNFLEVLQCSHPANVECAWDRAETMSGLSQISENIEKISAPSDFESSIYEASDVHVSAVCSRSFRISRIPVLPPNFPVAKAIDTLQPHQSRPVDTLTIWKKPKKNGRITSKIPQPSPMKTYTIATGKK